MLRKPVPSMFNCRILDSGYTGRTAPSPQPVAAADVALQQAALAAVGYVYPHARASGVAAKMSVSELRRGLLEDDEYTHTAVSYTHLMRRMYMTIHGGGCTARLLAKYRNALELHARRGIKERAE